MQNIFNNQIVRRVRAEVNDLRWQSNRNSLSNSERPPLPNAPPVYYHQPPSAPQETDTYSPTAHSTAGYSQTNTYPVLTNSNSQRERQSLLGKIESTATNFVGNLVGQDAAVYMSHKINSAVTNGRTARELLQNGKVVQLISKKSGRPLQIVMSPNGRLTFDGNGLTNAFNSCFTIEEIEKAFYYKQPTVLTLPPGTRNNSKIEFRVHDILGSTELIALESRDDQNSFISITSNGHLKTMHIDNKTTETQFLVVPATFNMQVSYPCQQAANNPYGNYQQNAASGYASPQPPPYDEQSYTAPPPPYQAIDPLAHSSASANVYPKF